MTLNYNTGGPDLDQATSRQGEPVAIPKRVTIKDARDYLNTNDKAFWVVGWNECVDAMEAPQPAQQGEPVAWMMCSPDKVTRLTMNRPTDQHRSLFSCISPLYAAPQPAQPLPAHEIVTMYEESPTSDSDMIEFARAVERAHGIGAAQKGQQ